MKNKALRFGAAAAVLLGLAAVVVLLDKTGLLTLPDNVGGMIVGLGTGFGVFCLSNALFARYYDHNEKARRAAEIEDKDERTQAIRGQASYRALLADTPIFLAVWAALLILDVSLWALLLVCAGYLAHFGVYFYHLCKLQREL